MDIQQPEPCLEVLFVGIKERPYPIPHVRCNILKSGMFNPLFSGIVGQWEVIVMLPVHAISQGKKTSKTDLREDGVGRSGKDVVSRDI